MIAALFLSILTFKGTYVEAYEISLHPQNVVAQHCKGEVKLICKFTTVVEECSWLRNAQRVDIKQRYEFIGSNNGKKDQDCSITISKPSKDYDEGNWTCSHTIGSEFTTGTKSRPAYLKINCEQCGSCSELPIPDSHPTQPIQSTPYSNKDEKIDTVIIAVAAIGGIVVIIIIIICIIVCWQCRKKKRKTCEHGPRTTTPAAENIRYTDPNLQPMLLLQQGQYNFPPGLGSNIHVHPSIIGMMPPQPVIQQQYQTLTTGQYLVPVAITPSSVTQAENIKPTKQQTKMEKTIKYENILQEDHHYDEIEEA